MRTSRAAGRLGAKSLCGTGSGLGRFLFTIFGRGIGLERAKEAIRCIRDFVDRREKSWFVCFGRFVEAGDLSDELQRSSSNFLSGDRWIEIKEHPNISAHAPTSADRKKPQSTILRHTRPGIKFLSDAAGGCSDFQRHQTPPFEPREGWGSRVCAARTLRHTRSTSDVRASVAAC